MKLDQCSTILSVNMKALILVVLVVLMQFSVAFAGVATKCNLDDCKIESDCRCSDAPSPLNPITDYPQVKYLIRSNNFLSF